jgi:predicted Zn-dependent protease with MMP-like domain
MNWNDVSAPSIDEIDNLAREAFASLPEEFRALTGDVVFMVQDFPDPDVMQDMDLDSEFEIMGLFQGPDLADREGGSNAPQQTMIFLYRRPILDYWAEEGETLGHIVRHVLIHEIGHHFGLSDEDMEAIEENE